VSHAHSSLDTPHNAIIGTQNDDGANAHCQDHLLEPQTYPFERLWYMPLKGAENLQPMFYAKASPNVLCQDVTEGRKQRPQVTPFVLGVIKLAPLALTDGYKPETMLL